MKTQNGGILALAFGSAALALSLLAIEQAHAA